MSVDKEFAAFRNKQNCVVAITCLLVFAGLSMPVLNHWRTRSRLNQCKMNMMNIALATHRFHDSNQRLPTATIGYSKAVDANAWSNSPQFKCYWRKKQNTSALLAVFTYLDRTSISRESRVLIDYDNQFLHPIASDIDTMLSDYGAAYPIDGLTWQGEIPGCLHMAQQQVNEFRCPEDTLYDQAIEMMIATQPCQPSPMAAMGTNDLCRDIATQEWRGKEPLATTNYLACLGALGGQGCNGPERIRWLGAMTPGSKVTLETVADGTSRTIM